MCKACNEHFKKIFIDENEGGSAVQGIGGGIGTGGGSPATRPLGIGQGPTKGKFAKRKKPLIHLGYKKDRKAK